MNKKKLFMLENGLLIFALAMFLFYIVYLHVFGEIRLPFAYFEYYQRGLPKEERAKLLEEKGIKEIESSKPTVESLSPPEMADDVIGQGSEVEESEPITAATE